MGELKLRDPKPGDLGWVVHRHGVLYAREYGWNLEFEALVASIVGDFVKNFDKHLDRCWIAELDGKIVGSVFIVKHTGSAAKLRMLYVEPEARGHGVGRRLVDAALEFSRTVGHASVMLWTNPQLTAARKIYEAVGFEMIDERTEEAFGVEFVSQTWKLEFGTGK
jgi:GNAT superfamily N-acetyltransferase